jgi:hypothetical protein
LIKITARNPSELPGIKTLRSFLQLALKCSKEEMKQRPAESKVQPTGPLLWLRAKSFSAMIGYLEAIFKLSPLRRMCCSLFFVGAAIAAFAAIGSPRAAGQGHPGANKIEPWVIDHTANGQMAELMVVLVDQADLRAASALATKDEKSRYVHDALWNKSQAAQGSIAQWLREHNLEHRSFYIINGILVKGIPTATGGSIYLPRLLGLGPSLYHTISTTMRIQIISFLTHVRARPQFGT